MNVSTRKKIGLSVLLFPLWGFVLILIVRTAIVVIGAGNTYAEVAGHILNFAGLLAVVSAILCIPVGLLMYFWK